MKLSWIVFLIGCGSSSETPPPRVAEPARPAAAPLDAAAAVAIDAAAIAQAPDAEPEPPMVMTMTGAGPADPDASKRMPSGDLDRQVRAIKSGSSAPPVPTGTITNTRVTIVRKFVEGGLREDDVVRKIVAAYVPAIKRCYAAALAKKPSLRDNLALDLDIAEDGHLDKPHADADTADLASCVTADMASWKFPPRKPATTAEVVLRLVPE